MALGDKKKTAARKSAAARATSRSSSTSSSSAVEAVVLVDLYRWHDEHGDPESVVHEAERGDTVKVSKEEFDRARAMTPPGLKKATSKEKAANEPVEIPSDLSELSDTELLDLATRLNADVDADSTRDELVGAVAAAPGGHERPNQ